MKAGREAMGVLLDNPVWYALRGAHAEAAIGDGLARQYPRDMTPFSALAEASPAAYTDLGRHLPRGLEARLFRTHAEPVPEGWESLSATPILQMVLDGPVRVERAASDELRIRLLTAQDTAALLDLAAATKPGPFYQRTAELGTYVGIFRGERLVAMAGERFRLPGYVELSAIAVETAARGRGLAAALMIHLCRRAAERGDVPFLHVFPSNPAVALYQRLWFRTRAQLWVLWRRPFPA
jgi:predicted GNAT family acetyltransferase